MKVQSSFVEGMQKADKLLAKYINVLKDGGFSLTNKAKNFLADIGDEVPSGMSFDLQRTESGLIQIQYEHEGKFKKSKGTAEKTYQDKPRQFRVDMERVWEQEWAVPSVAAGGNVKELTIAQESNLKSAFESTSMKYHERVVGESKDNPAHYDGGICSGRERVAATPVEGVFFYDLQKLQLKDFQIIGLRDFLARLSGAKDASQVPNDPVPTQATGTDG